MRVWLVALLLALVPAVSAEGSADDSPPQSGSAEESPDSSEQGSNETAPEEVGGQEEDDSQCAGSPTPIYAGADPETEQLTLYAGGRWNTRCSPPTWQGQDEIPIGTLPCLLQIHCPWGS